jgi:Arc/MetJ-type ribon-helix-helix transcriptional regulator
MAGKRPEGDKREGTKNMVLRLDHELAEQLQLVAEAERRSVSEVVREAIAEAVERRRGDERFIRLLEEHLRRHRRLLELLRDQGGQR